MMSRFKRHTQIFLIIIIIMLFVLIGVPVGVVVGFWRELPSLDSLEYENKSWQFPSKIYSDIAHIYPESNFANLVKRLERLNYQSVDSERLSKGEYHLKIPDNYENNEVRIYLNELNYPRFNRGAMTVRLKVEKSNIVSITSEDGLPMDEFILEPEELDEFYGGEGIDREIVSLAEVPEMVRNAFIAIEDKRFYKHSGIDPYRIIGALWYNIRNRSREQGGSTITQQLARDLFLTKDKLITRKIKEWLMAIKIERKYTKDEILERYINRINLGRVGSREIYGIEQASKYYFGKHVWEISIPESATLAGIPQLPPKYSPIRNPENSKKRRQVVLRKMLDLGYITKTQYTQASESPLMTMSIGDSWSMDIAYFLEYIRTEMEKKFEQSAIYSQGLNIYTSLDMSMQLFANSAVQKHLKIMDKSLKFNNYDENKSKWFSGDQKNAVSPESYIQSALVAIEPPTGYVKAMVGGRDFSVNQFNRAVQAKRQPGSSFKPFVYCTAFANKITPSDILLDAPLSIKVPEGRWEPKNISHSYSGEVTVRKALTRSLNVPSVRLLLDGRVGIDRVIELAQAMGIQSTLTRVPSIALGSSEVNVLEMTSAYGVWANQGLRLPPTGIKFVVDRENNILLENTINTLRPKKVMEKNVAYVTTHVMKGVIDGGTGGRARSLGFKRPAAGKTGTTNDETDAWFLGFIPNLVTGVWVGFDAQKSTRRTGSEAAIPIWTDFMKNAVDGPIKDFTVPSGVTFGSGGNMVGSTSTIKGRSEEEAYIEGTNRKNLPKFLGDDE